MGKVKLIVHAGHHNREYCPVSVEVDPAIVGKGAVCVDLLNGKGEPVDCIPVQVERRHDKTVVWFIVDRLDAARTATYQLTTCSDVSACSPRYGPAELREHTGEKVDAILRGSLFTSYLYDTDKWVRPILYPVIGPFGKGVTREIEGEEGPDHDHVHHKSIYVAHGDVNGVNCWSEMPGDGRIRHESFKRLKPGVVFAEISARNRWESSDGKKLCEQTSNIRFYNMPSNLRLVDYVIKFHATEGDLRFGDTKEGGILSLRVQPTMNVTRFGYMENAYGAINEAECWGRRAPWMDYAGPVCGEWVGITYMNHPSSFRYPTYWHARDYGLMTANPFGLSDFLGEGHDGSYTLPAGESLTFSYRIYIHPGDTTAGKVADHFHNYVNPPKVEVVA